MADSNLVQGNDFAETTITAKPITSSSFLQRRLRITFTLSKNSEGKSLVFPRSGTNTLTLNNLRASARINNAMGVNGGELYLRIYGMALSDMNAINYLGLKFNRLNPGTVTLEAGDFADEDSYTTVYIGQPIECMPRFHAMPDVEFYVQANTNADIAMLQFNVPPSQSFQTPTISVATVLKQLATQCGRTFVNKSNFDAQIPSPHLYGTPLQQIQDIVDATPGLHCNYELNTVTISPDNESSSSYPLISPSTGMIEFPTYWQSGIKVKTLFNPQVRLQDTIQVKSAELAQTLPQNLGGPTVGGQTNLSVQEAIKAHLWNADGLWKVNQMNHFLDSYTPNGNWYSEYYCYNTLYAGPETVIPSSGT
jgi:hypothetical protein